MAIENDHIVCDRCGYRFERGSEYKHCSNCFACTGCEIYYCPACDDEIIVTPIKKARRASDNSQEQKSDL